MNALNKTILTLGGLLSFFAFGFIDNLKGAALPEILRAESLDYGQGGVLLLSAYVGFIIATLVTGVISDAFGNRFVLFLSGGLLCFGLVGIGFANSTFAMAIMLLVMGLGLGAIEVGANGLLLELHPKAPGRFLNLLATFHGIGSLLVPLYVASLLNVAIRWQTIFMLTASLGLPIAFIFRGKPLRPNAPLLFNTKKGEQQIWKAAFTLRMMLFYVLIATYVAVELGAAAWMVEYLQQVEDLSVSSSSLTLSGFFAMIMLGRLVGAWFADRVAYLAAVACGLSGGVLCITAGLFGPPGCYLLLPLSGLFLSIVFPTVTAHVTNMHAVGKGTVMGILFTFGGIGGALGPWVVGQVAKQSSIQIGIAMTIAFGLASLLALGAIQILMRIEQRVAE